MEVYMGYICDKPKGSCKKCNHYRFDDDRQEYACFAEQDTKKQRTPNEYIGMSEQELDREHGYIVRQKESLQWDIKSNMNKIAELEKQIEGFKKGIVNLNNQLKRIETARKHSSQIELVNIISVYKDSVCIDKDPGRYKGYYFQSMTKDLVLYNFRVLQVNKADYNKANKVLYDSCNNRTLKIDNVFGLDKFGYLSNQRKKLQEDILHAMDSFDIVDVYFGTDVNLGRTLIEKKLGHEVITS